MVARKELSAVAMLNVAKAPKKSETVEHLQLEPARLRAAKVAFAARRVTVSDAASLIVGDVQPRAGDLVLAEVVEILQHTRLQLPSGRRTHLFEGDEIIVAYGNRYAPGQFEAEVPGSLDPCHLVAAGGMAAKALSWHESLRAPTRLNPVGLLADSTGQVMNLADFAIKGRLMQAYPRPATFAVAGTTMDSGKTTTAAHLIKGMSRAGLRVGAAKVTGTGAGGDYWFMKDAGAEWIVDFTDAGYASTYMISMRELENVFATLVGYLQHQKPDVIVLEIADGLLQQETSALLSSPQFASNVDGIIFAAQESMAAAAGVDWLRQRNLPVVAISGLVSASPLGAKEAAKECGVPVLSKDQLSDPDVIIPYVLSPQFQCKS